MLQEMREDNVLVVDSMVQVPMARLVEQGHLMLDKHQLSDAEEYFHKALECQAEPVDPCYKHYITALLGLAEVYRKRGRSVRHVDLEWQRMYLLALSAHRKAIECCQQASQQLHDNKLTTWFSEQKDKAISQHHILQDQLVNTLHEKVLQQERIRKYFKPRSKTFESISSIYSDPEGESEWPDVINLDWLKKIEDYYKEKCKSERFLRSESKESIVMDDEAPILPIQQQPKKVNFEKVHSAIQKIVKHISEMGQYKIHPKMTPEEKLLLISPYTSRYDLFKEFTKALGADDSDSSSGDQSPHLAVDAEDGLQEDAPVTASQPDHNMGVEKFPITWYTAEPPQSSAKSTIHISHSQSVPYLCSELHGSKDADMRHGVLTIWRRYENELPKPKPLVAYKFHTYEELSPLTEVVTSAVLVKELEKESKEKEQDQDLPEQSPVSEASVSLSMALTLCNMADKLNESGRLKEAVEIYKHALGILQSYSGSKRAFLPHMAKILQKLGVVKVAMGDFMGGSQLMEESIILLESSDDADKQFKIARVWFELGKACMADEWKASTLHENIMLTVKDTLQREVKHEPSEISDDVSEDDDDSECGDAYSVCTQEATTFFHNALSILGSCQRSGADYAKLLVDVLTNLGDCLIMNGNFDSAILYYEEALKMFKSYVGEASIESNAHVLSMLATANFLLCNYPKAISLYECANVMYQHLYGEKEQASFDMAFALTMIGISYHCMTHYHRCIQWCLKAFEAYTVLFKDKTKCLKVLDRWFITETLYTLGFSYSTLNFHDNSIFYLDLAHKMLDGVAGADIKQDVKIMKVMADEFAVLEDNERALEYYNEALNKSMVLGNEQSATALQNQLLNRMAGIHINTKDYTIAADYLKKALDHQKNVQHTIQFDMIDMLCKLGVTYTLSGDIDKAIDCYNECVEELSDKSELYKSELAQILGKLGTLYHVKACIQDSNEEMIELLLSAEQHYQEALDLEADSTVSVQYANYLYQQGQAGDALLTMLPYVHIHSNNDDSILTFYGVEQAVLPEHIQQDVDDIDELTIDAPVFAKFLAVLCYRQLQLTGDADDCLLSLVQAVDNSALSLNHSMLAYALMEMELFDEAAASFRDAAQTKHHNELSKTNCLLALGTDVYHRWMQAFRNIYEATHKDQILDSMIMALTDHRPLRDKHVTDEQSTDAVTNAHEFPESSTQQKGEVKESIRDSGYYDTALEREYSEVDENEPLPKIVSPDDIELPDHYKSMSASTIAILKQLAASKESLGGSRMSLAASGQSNGSKYSLLGSRQSLVGSRQSLTNSHQSLNRSDITEEESFETATNIYADKGYFSSEYLESQGLDDPDFQPKKYDKWEMEEPISITLTGVPEDDEHVHTEEYKDREESKDAPVELLQLLQQQQEEAIAREAHIFGEILNPEKEAPKANEEPHYLTRPISYEEPSYGHWRGLSYSSNSVNRIGESSRNSELRRSSSASDEWITTEEEVVETPLAILNILEKLRASKPDLNKSISSQDIYQAAAPEKSMIKTSHSDEWSTNLEPQVQRGSSQNRDVKQRYSYHEEIPMDTSPEHETPPFSASKYQSSFSHPLTSSSYMLPGTQTIMTPVVPTVTAIRPTTVTTNNNNERMTQNQYQFGRPQVEPDKCANTRGTLDEWNGNQKASGKESEETTWEEWTTSEETVDTPPEILRYLAQQHVQ